MTADDKTYQQAEAKAMLGTKIKVDLRFVLKLSVIEFEAKLFLKIARHGWVPIKLKLKLNLAFLNIICQYKSLFYHLKTMLVHQKPFIDHLFEWNRIFFKATRLLKYPCRQCDHQTTSKGDLAQHIMAVHDGVQSIRN